jgi:hypothetical protein
MGEIDTFQAGTTSSWMGKWVRWGATRDRFWVRAMAMSPLSINKIYGVVI